MSLEENRRSHGTQRIQAMMHIGMGVFYIIVGVLVIYVKYFGTMGLPTGVAYVLGTLMLAYGIFRIWRGATWLKMLKRQR